MLRLLFQGLENFLGPSLAQVSLVLYWGGLILLAYVAFQFFWWSWLYFASERVGLRQTWTVDCPSCRRTVPVKGATCSRCGKSLRIPLPLRLRARDREWLHGPLTWRLGLAYQIVGAFLFLFFSLQVAIQTGALSESEGALHRLFLGSGMLVLAALGRLSGRVLRFGRRGVVRRAGDGLQALAALGVLAVILFLAGAARPRVDTTLARFTISGKTDQGEKRLLPDSNGQVGFEYMQLDHDILGYRRIVPLALVGRERVTISMGTLSRWLVEHFRRYAEAYGARGFTIRVRTDWQAVAAGASYEVVETEGQVFIRSRGSPG
jgi:hypothetical protein